MSSNSPIEPANGHRSSVSGYGSGSGDGSKNPLSMSLEILKNLTEKKNTRVDGQEPKRRGPKPDSKPALTRRQELNRQAQRTHRERKELYIKGLEAEVQRLKDNFSNAARDKNSLAEENRELKQLLARHGITWTGNGGADEFNVNDFTNMSSHVSSSSNRGPSSTGYTSGSSISGPYASGSAAYSPPPLSNGSNGSRSMNQSPTSPHHFGSGGVMSLNGHGNDNRQHQGMAPTSHDDYVQQIGIDFVLTLERPCMEHMQPLMDHAEPTFGDLGELEKPGEPCGHALMASCPPSASPANSVPWAPVPYIDASPIFKLEDDDEKVYDFVGKDGTLDMTGKTIQQSTWNIPRTDLANLMDLSRNLNLGGEITPVDAWGMVRQHARFPELAVHEIKELAGELVQRVRCYGFGAVLEEFEVRDALDALFFRKPDPMTLNG